MTLWSYLKERYTEFFLLAVGLFLLSIQPLVIFYIFTILPFFPSNILLSTFLFHIAIVSVVVGLTFIWWAFTRLSGMVVLPYHSSLLLLLYFSLGFLIKSSEVKITPGGSAIVFDPPWAHIIVGIPLVLLFFEVYKISRPKNSSALHQGWMSAIGWIIVALSVFISLLERLLSSNTVYYQIFGALGLFLVVYALLLDPFAIIPHVVGGQYLIVATKRGGVYVYFQQFVDSPSFNTGLFSAAMKGIFDTLCELTGKEDVPDIIGFNDLKIVIASSNTLIGYFVCRLPIPPVNKALNRILLQLEKNVHDQGFFEVIIDPKFHSEVHRMLQFAL